MHVHEKSEPPSSGHHKNSPGEKTDGGSVLLGIWKKSPREKKINLRPGIYTELYLKDSLIITLWLYPKTLYCIAAISLLKC